MTNKLKGGGAKVFKYEQLDGDTAKFLRTKESNMREIVGKAYTDLGKELTEAQQELAKQGSKYDGVFESWYTYLGWKKRTVYNLIDRFNLVQNLHEVSEKERIEDLPVSLTYAISAPSAESTPEKAQAKAEVLAGEIDTNKAYRERIKELEAEKAQAEQRAAQAQRREELAIQKLEEFEDGEPEVEIRTEYVEVADEATQEKIKRYEELFGDVSMYDGQITRVTNGDAITYAVFEFGKDVREFIEKFGHLTHFAREFNEMIDEGKDEYMKSINDMRRFLTAIERNLDEVEATIIEG